MGEHLCMPGQCQSLDNLRRRLTSLTTRICGRHGEKMSEERGSEGEAEREELNEDMALVLTGLQA